MQDLKIDCRFAWIKGGPFRVFMKHINSSSNTYWIHSTRLHVILYGMLLIATPFILLQSFLVEFIVTLSDSSVELFGLTIKIVPVTALILAFVIAAIYRSYITRLRIIIAIVVVLINALAQQITDYYFGHSFYDLQQNWHYIAYGIFAYMVYRDLEPRGFPPARMIQITYLAALVLSLFDEIFQMYSCIGFSVE